MAGPLTFAVANTKGGCGKTTIATHLAAHFAARGYHTGLGDLDRQHSSLRWVKRRPKELPAIVPLDLEDDQKIPKSLERLVVDAGAAMVKAGVKDMVETADVILIPVTPSIFDEDGLARFLKHLEGLKTIRKNKRSVGVIANRVRLRTRAARHLDGVLDDMGHPVVARLRESQNYVNAALDGQTIFDYTPSKVRNLLADWDTLAEFVSRCENPH